MMNFDTVRSANGIEKEDWEGNRQLDVTSLASDIVTAVDFNYIFELDDAEMLEYLIERTGGCFDYKIVMNKVEEDVKTSRKRKPEKPRVLILDLFLNRIIDNAVFFGAESIIKWILNKGGEQAFAKFLLRSGENQSSRRAKKLADAIVSAGYVGLAQLRDPAVILSNLFCGSLSMEDEYKRSPFHYAIMGDRPEVIKLMVQEANRRQDGDTAFHALNKVRTVEKYNPERDNYRYAHHCGTNALQSSILMSRTACMKTLLDFGVDIFPKDGKGEREWNLLTFAICSKSTNRNFTSIDTVKALLDHPRISPEVRQGMICERMGSGQVTPLMVAASRSCQDIVKLLRGYLPAGGMLPANSQGSTALHIATRKRGWEIIPSLVDHQGKDHDGPGNKSEIVELVASEDYVGLTSLDICMNIACSVGKEMGKTPARHRKPNEGEQHSRMEAVLNVTNRLKDSNPSHKKKRHVFEAVQTALLKATKEPNDEAISRWEACHGYDIQHQAMLPETDLVDYGDYDLNTTYIRTFDPKYRYTADPFFPDAADS